MHGTFVVEIIAYDTYYCVAGEYDLATATEIANDFRKRYAGSGVAVRIINLAFATRR